MESKEILESFMPSQFPLDKFERWNVYITSLEELKKLYWYKNILKLTSTNIEEQKLYFQDKILKIA